MAPTNPFEIPTSKPNTDYPTDIDMHTHIRHQKRSGTYYSITTLPSPYTSWSPVPKHGNMESRPCHCSKSRIHELACGHMVAVEKDAEICAQNCIGMAPTFHSAEAQEIFQGLVTPDPKRPVDMSPIPSKTRFEEKMMQMQVSAHLAIKIHIDTFLKPMQSQRALQQSWILFNAYKEMQFVFQKPKADLLSTFLCRECQEKTEGLRGQGERATVPAWVFREMGCVVVGRDERDMMVLDAVKKGWRPEKKKEKERKNAVRSGGAGRCGRDGRGVSVGSGVVYGRVSKEKKIVRARVNEKATVIARLREEELLENMGGMIFWLSSML